MANEAVVREQVEAESGVLLETGEPPFLYTVTAQTPWWIVSILLHGLVIALAGLATWGIELPENDFPLVIQEFFESKALQTAVEKKTDPMKVLEEEFKATETDPNGAKPERNLIVTPDLLALAEPGYHNETINLDLPNTHEAHGNPDAEIMWLVNGRDEPAGGGGNEGLSMSDDVIGIGSASAGKGGGFGGGEGKGIGLGKGDFTGSFGGRGGGRKLMLTRQKGGSGTECFLEKALQWLAYHQEADGRWDAKKYGASVKTDTACTGFALLAFLGAGHTEKIGNFKGTVQRAVAWLKSKQAADGCIWDTSDDNAHHRKIGYPCAIATLAMAEAAGMANVPDTKVAAQKAIDYAVNIHQCGEGYEKGGWRYAPKQEGDLSVTGWFVMALKSAKVSGLNVPPAAFEGAIRFLDQVEVKDGGSSGYGVASRYKYMANNEHAHTAHRLGAIGNLARQFLGWKREDLQASVEWFVNKGGAPSYGANGEAVDLYYWYYGTMCVFQQTAGDKNDPLWKRWNTEMKTALVGHQCKQGDDAGSWNPTGDFSGEWGRVGQTALSALCLEVYYRHEVLK